MPKALKNVKLLRSKASSIIELPAHARPREKLVHSGPASLSNAELVAVMINSGTARRNVFKVAKDILAMIESANDVPELNELKKIEGVGVARACLVMAALEFAKRLIFKEGVIIRTAGDVISQVPELRHKKQEHFLILTLDGASRLIKKKTVFIGTLNQSLIHPREIFVEALCDRAASIALIHNHPSGDVSPSREDMAITARLVEAGKLLGIIISDHVIVSDKSHFSFKENALI